jgi:hypothetical protein
MEVDTVAASCMEYPQAISTCREGHSGFFDARDHLATSWKKKKEKFKNRNQLYIYIFKKRNFVTQIDTNKD